MGVRGWLEDRAEDVADNVADGVDVVSEEAGEFVDSHTKTLAAGLDWFGLEGAADTVDTWGDYLADKLGAEIAELELGDTDDPKKLIHGDAAAINETAGHLADFADGFNTAAGGLKAIDAGTFTGHAGSAYDEVADLQPRDWSRAGSACARAARAWAAYGATVEWAQGKAQDAIDAHKRALAATDAARADHSEALATYRRENDAFNAEMRAGDTSQTPPVAPGEFVDPGVDKLVAARAMLARARRQRDSAAENALRSIRSATTDAPAEPRLSEQLRAGFGDLGTIAMVEKVHFDMGALKGLSGLVGTLRGLNVTDPYNLRNPADYLKGLSDTAAGLIAAGQHPDRALAGMLGQLRDDPSEFLGTLAPEVLLGLLTGGAGAAAGRSDDVLRAADDVLEQRHRGRPECAMTCDRDPVDVATGEVLLPQTDLVLPGVLPLVLSRVHKSGWRWGRWFGRSWASTLDERLVVDEDRVVLVRGDGVLLVYPVPATGESVLPFEGPRWPLERPHGDTWRVSDPDTRQVRHYVGGDRAVVPLAAITSRSGGDRIMFVRDEDGAPLEVRHSGGYRVLVETGGMPRRVVALQVADGEDEVAVLRFGYSPAGDLAEVVNSSGKPLGFEYDALGRLLRWEDRNGVAFGYSYDRAGRCVEQAGTGGAMGSTFDYFPDADDDRGTITVVTDSLDARTAYHVNERLQVVATVDPAGGVTRQEWDRYDRLLTRTDPLDRTTRFGYDKAGNLTRVVRPDDSIQRWSYAGVGLPTVAELAGGARWQQEYDEHGRRVALVDPARAATCFEYGARGHLVAVTDALGGVTRIANDAAGLPVVVTDAGGAVTRLERDGFGRVTAVVNANGDRTTQTWTVEGLPASRTLPDGATETRRYDGEGNLVEHVDAAGHATSYTYGAFDKPVSITAPDGSVTELVHDTELRLTAVVNGLGLEWTYRYDAAGRLSEERDFNGRTLRHRYDDAGQLIGRTNGAGQSVAMGYDLLGRLVTQVDGDGRETRFGYDAAGRLTAADNPDARVAFERDAAGRVLAEAVDGRTVRSAYDPAGRRTSRLTPTGVESAWTYDAVGRALAVDVAGHVTRFERDAVGRERLRQWDSGAALAQLFDDAGRVSVQTLSAPLVGPSPRTLHERQYRYRPDGALLGIDDTGLGASTFDLDPRGRVTGVHVTGPSRGSLVERYAYDGAGNLTAGDDFRWSGADGRVARDRREHVGTLLQRTRDTRFSYDRQGRLVQRVRTRLSRKPEVWHYTWDAEDRLVGLTTPDGARWRYLYDALGRRVAKERLAVDGSVASRTTFTWDGTTLVEQTGAGGSTSWEYDGLRPLAQLERSSDSLDARFYAIVTDLVGAPTELLDESGNIAWRSDRNLWGAPSPRASRAATPLAFPGQYADSESGLFYNLFRYYDPHTATYISQDPLGLHGGPNPSAYVHNPTQYADPLGLFSCDPDDLPGHSERHQFPGTWAGKSQFFDAVDLRALSDTDGVVGFVQKNGNTRYLMHASSDIGVDQVTGLPTDVYTVIVKPDGEVLTMFPGSSRWS
ncbi:putative T7SS-secreted protein [Nocardioides speluncae]|uniref:putative T7SS-secreted protein n=1 Tax=Nocardioides speluncae TaxID=2670337 RepID=UPI000D68AA66|nr:DUF6531 domain-containing protein [Nocardioides speluncae]